ncbi:hypothetical protein EP517_04760 [Salmonella enterica]|uniref:Uncharacterized protein n=4 Tax=Salmonella enterica TaxID=28901 RepID=A0A3U9T2G7_SALER|nr:hypothetical protein [Salmonella enterica subsp. salamae]EAB2011101.1 hypothetical protein [Salmonella enterica]EBI0475699.1 hypothetical protein [Salmonella enterica subsp. enterica serovar Braenderup]ECT8651011.1 hypothetical protein [Salmonella enterica subsp. salamae serovar 50:b:z6]HAC6410757.1 hypothetical protein [Salmonella enterica subsp. salamae serovar 58:a:-]
MQIDRGCYTPQIRSYFLSLSPHPEGYRRDNFHACYCNALQYHEPHISLSPKSDLYVVIFGENCDFAH